jgi:hypothetical protein
LLFDVLGRLDLGGKGCRVGGKEKLLFALGVVDGDGGTMTASAKEKSRNERSEKS